VKLPRTIRLDPSDTFVFARPAEPGQWAVPGSFLFVDRDPAGMDPKERVAFRSGFVGIEGFGFSTLAVVTPARPDELEAATQLLAQRLVEHCGAPDLATAIEAAREEMAFAASLCDHPEGTLLALQRGIEDGELRERFRTLTPRSDGGRASDLTSGKFRAFEFVETDEDEVEVEEHVDLLSLGRAPAPTEGKP
jgi:hypothetical protein